MSAQQGCEVVIMSQFYSLHLHINKIELISNKLNACSLGKGGGDNTMSSQAIT